MENRCAFTWPTDTRGGFFPGSTLNYLEYPLLGESSFTSCSLLKAVLAPPDMATGSLFLWQMREAFRPAAISRGRLHTRLRAKGVGGFQNCTSLGECKRLLSKDQSLGGTQRCVAGQRN